jgi:hypothetical protein
MEGGGGQGRLSRELKGVVGRGKEV